MSEATFLSWRSRLVAGGMMAALLAASGCSWRLDSEPPVWPSPDAVTLERDAAAVHEQHVQDALGSTAGSAGSASVLANLETTASPAHLAALGGVYVARPGLEPSPYVGTLAAAVADARDHALATAATTDDRDLAALLGSIGLTHAFALWYDSLDRAPADEADIDPVAERPLPDVGGVAGPPVVAEQTALSADTVMALAVAHDQARYLYETIAARSSDDARTQARARMAIHDDRAQALATLSGADDARSHVYSLPLAQVTGAQAQAATARETEQSLGWRYAALAAESDATDRGWLLSAAFDAYAASASLPGFTLDEFPVLPGLEVAPAAP
jgi:hypothetical protein